MYLYTVWQKAKCSCGFVWTTGQSQSVLCKCMSGSIENDTINNLEAATWSEIKTAVANELEIDEADLELIDGGTDLRY